MRILVLHAETINHYPPTYSLINNLLENGHQVTLISYDAGSLKSINQNSFKYIDLDYGERYTEKNLWDSRSLLFKLKEERNQSIEFNHLFNKYYRDYDLVWATSDIVCKLVGRDLYKSKYILQLMELRKDIPTISKQRVFMVGLSEYAKHAFKVVVPEYNRAHIIKAWWNLKDTPTVLPNKPYTLDRFPLTEDESRKLDTLKAEKKKILLYQGTFTADRDLAPYVEACKELEDYFSLYMIGNEGNEIDSLCQKYPQINYLGFVNPPNYLYFTEQAYIGLMPYHPSTSKTSISDILNAVYCAPNKIYEYSAYGVPMIGPDVPGLYYPFKSFQIGKCIERTDVKTIIEAVKYVDETHEQMSKNCRCFYDSIDLNLIVNRILAV